MNFWKYQGAGNDFIMVDDRSELFDISDFKKIELLCNRRFGIGADGLILLREFISNSTPLEMVYFNSDKQHVYSDELPDYDSVNDIYFKDENSELINKTLNKLSEKHKCFIRACYYDNLTMIEIAERFNYNGADSAKNQKCKILKKFSALFLSEYSKTDIYYN